MTCMGRRLDRAPEAMSLPVPGASAGARTGAMCAARRRRRDQEMLCTAVATGLSPLTSSSVLCRVPGSRTGQR